MAERPPEIGSIAWTDLTVKDAPAVRDFSAAVVGGKPEAVAMGDYSDYTLCAHAPAKGRGKVETRSATHKQPQQRPPPWWNSKPRWKRLTAAASNAPPPTPSLPTVSHRVGSC